MKNDNPQLPILAVTMGDAAGVGPELCLRLLAHAKLHRRALPLVLGNARLLARVARASGLPFDCAVLDKRPTTSSLAAPAVLDVPFGRRLSLSLDAIQPGRNQALCGRFAAACIREAVRGCLERRYAAMVTAPISKKALNLGGIDYPGHTEMLAALTAAKSYAMLLYSEPIACAFVTCHQPLRSVARSLNAARVVEVARLAWESVRVLRGKHQGAAARRLCLLGLNPHAGEEGLFGSEERRILLPARRRIEKLGIPIEGPLPPDTAFTPRARKRYGCYIALYHDQGSIPFKMLAFDSGVNVTMGLPIVRTSPDHGTAFDIAWRGTARPESFFAAYETAVQLIADCGLRIERPRIGEPAVQIDA